MTISYIPVQKVDVDTIYTFCEELIALYETDPIDLDKVLPWCRRKIEATLDEYCCILQDGKKAGYIHVCPPENGVMELDDFYLYESFRGQGIGSTVLAELCANADEKALTLRLYCFKKNVRALCLYKRHGFVVADTAGGSRFIMERTAK